MKVLITRKLPGDYHKLLQNNYEVILWDKDEVIAREFLIENIKDVDGLLCLLTDKIDKEVIDKAKRLKVISNYAVGFDNIDVEYATLKGIVVTNTPGVLTETSADLVWALILAARRHIISADKFLRDGKFKGWDPNLFLGYDVHSKTLGIIGLGRIGQAVAKRAKGFNMKVIYYNRTPKPDIEEYFLKEYNMKLEYKSLDDLLRESDIVSINTPLNNETYHLITYEKLKLMKNTATIINTARGPVIKEDDLVKALKEGLIFSAGLDVFEFEPKVNEELLKLDNVVLLPHIGSASFETREKMAEIAVNNLLLVLQNKEPLYSVNYNQLKNIYS
ncbi:MAG: D-glycerate dehydrogenase [bacterium]|nr:D-glycerate dehydrogenase [bacterium]